MGANYLHGSYGPGRFGAERYHEIRYSRQATTMSLGPLNPHFPEHGHRMWNIDLRPEWRLIHPMGHMERWREAVREYEDALPSQSQSQEPMRLITALQTQEPTGLVTASQSPEPMRLIEWRPPSRSS